MGGPGSGTWYRWNRRAVLEERLAIDVRRWKREGLLRPGLRFTCEWAPRNGAAQSISVAVDTQHVLLSYEYRPGGGDWHEAEQFIELASTACHFGGRRPWFLCPRCAHRAAKLFRHESSFACRRCAGLPYASQTETRIDRARRKARKIRGVLGADEDLTVPVMRKPRGMHWRTFDRLLAKVERAESVVEEGLARAFARLGGGAGNRQLLRAWI